MKVGDRVIYIEGSDPKTKEPRKFNALVLGERVVADHLGADDEPLLTLVFAKERIDSFGNPLPLHGTGQQSELVQYRVDVAHVSHEYDDDQKQKYNRTAYDGGRWFNEADQWRLSRKNLPQSPFSPPAVGDANDSAGSV